MIRKIRAPILAVAATTLSFATASAQSLDYIAPPGTTVLSTDSAVLQPTSGPPITVTGGVFRFRNVTVPAGSLLRGVGSHPMIWLVDSLSVSDELLVSGEDGEKVNTLNSANIPSRGGRGGANGGNGGAGSPQIALRSSAGQSGDGPGGVRGFGGSGGLIASTPNLGRGSAGGAGAFATIGDPFYGRQWIGGSSFIQQIGFGGFGGNGASGSLTRSLPGGGPGGSPFGDGDDENDFFGAAIDVFRRRIVTGELSLPIGGAGGGGGGDLAVTPGPLSPNWVSDAKGGGGGGGGGCLIVFANNSIVLSSGGHVTANGGHGGGGEQAGSCNEGGGGGAGSGGMLILAARGQIQIDVRGETYANLDYDFSLSADGGVCTTGTFMSPIVFSKYPNNGTLPMLGSNYDSAPLGGLGGMGVIQLVTPAGNNSDGTNTILDDNIVLVRNGQVLSGATKQRFLAWRGFKDQNGVRVDDAGTPIILGANDGDMRPAPILMPLR